MPNQTVSETQSDPVTLAVGEVLTLDLEENGTTGYSWHVQAPAGLAPASDGVFKGDRPGLAGASTRRVIRFEATEPGSIEVEARLRRPWEGSESAIKVLAFRVEVSPRPG